MGKFIPGKIVKTFISKKGKEIAIRYPKIEDLDELLRYINALSKEDTFVTFSGEVITKEEEEKFLKETMEAIEAGDKVYLQAFHNDRLIAVCNVDRDKAKRTRSLHVGLFGISADRNLRGEGIGYKIGKTTIDEARKNIPGLKMVLLDCFDCNVAGKALYKKLGFKLVGKIPNGIHYKGEYTDLDHFVLEL